MLRMSLAVLSSLALASTLAAAPNTSPSQNKLSAAEIVDKNVTARGGLQAWRAVQTLSMSGKMGAGGNRRATLQVPGPHGRTSLEGIPQRPAEEVQLPFTMDLARVRKSRVEILFKGQSAVQVYDGTNGWKLRPYLNRSVVENFAPDELKKASKQADLDGPLVDYAAKGNKVEFVGMDKVEGRDCYKLKLTLKSGDSLHVWIDAQSFLEAKIEGQPRVMDGAEHPVEVYYRDYRSVNGLEIPFVLETHVLPVSRTATGLRDTPVPPEKIVIEKVTVNPTFDASHFAKLEVTPTPAPPAPQKSK